MYNKIIETLEPLKIELAFQTYTGESDEYIIFNILDEKETIFADDKNFGVQYGIIITYWFKSLKNINRHTEIKNIMKKNGFNLDGSIKALEDKDIYGKSLDFTYTKLEEERG